VEFGESIIYLTLITRAKIASTQTKTLLEFNKKGVVAAHLLPQDESISSSQCSGNAAVEILPATPSLVAEPIPTIMANLKGQIKKMYLRWRRSTPAW
jgi:hypothetical protein